MITKNLVKKAVVGLFMAALIIVFANVETAYAQSGGGSSPASPGTINPQESVLYEKQREMDRYLFLDHSDEIANMGFKVIYTGVAYNYVEVGITPYKEEFAAFIYDKFGTELVKVVDAEEAVIYEADPQDAPDAMPVEPADNTSDSVSPIMDMGDDTPAYAHDSITDEALIKEREQLLADEKEKLTIQIESVDGDEPSEDMAPDRIREPGIAEDLPVDGIAKDTSDDADARLVAANEIAKTTAADDTKTEDKGMSTAGIIAMAIGGIIIIGGIIYLSAKKKTAKTD